MRLAALSNAIKFALLSDRLHRPKTQQLYIFPSEFHCIIYIHLISVSNRLISSCKFHIYHFKLVWRTGRYEDSRPSLIRWLQTLSTRRPFSVCTSSQTGPYWTNRRLREGCNALLSFGRKHCLPSLVWSMAYEIHECLDDHYLYRKQVSSSIKEVHHTKLLLVSITQHSLPCW